MKRSSSWGVVLSYETYQWQWSQSKAQRHNRVSLALQGFKSPQSQCYFYFFLINNHHQLYMNRWLTGMNLSKDKLVHKKCRDLATRCKEMTIKEMWHHPLGDDAFVTSGMMMGIVLIRADRWHSAAAYQNKFFITMRKKWAEAGRNWSMRM